MSSVFHLHHASPHAFLKREKEEVNKISTYINKGKRPSPQDKTWTTLMWLMGMIWNWIYQRLLEPFRKSLHTAACPRHEFSLDTVALNEGKGPQRRFSRPLFYPDDRSQDSHPRMRLCSTTRRLHCIMSLVGFPKFFLHRNSAHEPSLRYCGFE